MSTITKEMQNGISPDQAIEMLKEGNQRFLNKDQVNRLEYVELNLPKEVIEARDYQYNLI